MYSVAVPAVAGTSEVNTMPEDGTDRITKEQAADQGICYYVNDGCESDAVVLLHDRFPLCEKHYRKVIEA